VISFIFYTTTNPPLSNLILTIATTLENIVLLLLRFIDQSTTQLRSVVELGEKLLGQILLVKIALVLALFDQFNGLAISPLVSFIDPYNPSLTREGLSEVVQLEILESRINITHVVITFGFTVSCFYFPCAVVAQSIH